MKTASKFHQAIFLQLILVFAFLLIPQFTVAKAESANPNAWHESKNWVELQDGYEAKYTDLYGTEKEKYTSDPNHKGFDEKEFIAKNPKTGKTKKFRTTYSVGWKKVQTDCKPCKEMVKQYNKVMKEILNIRPFVAALNKEDPKEGLKELKGFKESSFHRKGSDGKINKSITGEAAALAIVLDYDENFKTVRAKQNKRLALLEALAQDLRAQIPNCEQQCKGKKPEIIIGDPGALILPYPWKGPYTTECWPCEKLAAHLNTLPGLTYPLLTEKTILEAKILEWEAYRLDEMGNLGSGFGWDDPEIDEADHYLSIYRPQLKEVNRKLDLIKKNFEKTLSMFIDCEKRCKPVKKTSCVFPEDNQKAITVGPNSEVGSGKEFTNKIKSQAASGLGSLLGGGMKSTGFGGFGGGSSKKDTKSTPKKVKDPTKGSFTAVSAGDTELEIRAGFTDDGFVVSTNIDDSPGDGTFEIQWLEDADGTIYLPTRYLILSLWRDWKLTVSWTYDRWVDGEHVEHREGSETTFGRDDLGTFIFKSSESEGYENSIWHILGFGTATKGVQKLGAVYELPASVTSGPCHLRLVTHVTLPDADPVITQPVSVTIGGEKGKVPVKDWEIEQKPLKKQIEPITL